MFTKDPVCGARLEVSGALACEVYAGTMYYFCSHACHERFKGNPERYASRTEGPN